MWLSLIWTKLKSPPLAALLPVSAEGPRYRDAGAYSPDESSAGPRHALQKTAAVDAILVEILQLLID
jgi:hypothetical protein